MRNQGFYVDQGASPGAHAANNSYIIGKLAGTLYRNYFSFSLSGPGAAQTVVGAKLELIRAQTNETNEATEFFGLFDVLTDAVTRNSGPYSQAVFEDLGMGVSYGVFGIDTTSGDPSDTLSFMLNDNAVEAINAAAVAGEDYFSMGGAHQSV